MTGLRSRLSAAKAAVLERLANRPITTRLAAPACSITFDDVPRSAITHGVPLLRRHQASATFYLAAGLCARGGFVTADDARGLVREGFDVACHTFSHYGLARGTARGLAADTDHNRTAFRDSLGLPRPRDFSYPFGEVSVGAKRLIGQRYASARGIYPGLNEVGSDLLLLRANPVFSGAIDWDRTRRLLDLAAARRAWVIFYTHGVEPDADRWSCGPEDFDRLLEAVRRAGLVFRTVRSVTEELLPQWVVASDQGPVAGRGPGGPAVA